MPMTVPPPATVQTTPATSKIVAKFQVTVPAEIRRIYDLQEGDMLDWSFNAQTSQLIVEPKRASLISPDLDKAVAASKLRQEQRQIA